MKRCLDFTSGLKKFQENDQMIGRFLDQKIVDAETLDRKMAEQEELFESLYFDKVEITKEINIPENYHQFKYQGLVESLKRNFFAFSPDGNHVAIQTDELNIGIFDQRDGSSVFINAIGLVQVVQSFSFVSNTEIMVNYCYESMNDGPQRGRRSFLVQDGSEVMDDSNTFGEIYLDYKDLRFEWLRGSGIHYKGGTRDGSVPDSRRVFHLKKNMQMAGDFIVCQDDHELYCFDGSGLTFQRMCFDSAVLGDKPKVAYYDDDISSLVVFDLENKRKEVIIKKDPQTLYGSIAYDKKGDNLLVLNIHGVVEVISIKEKRITHCFRAFDEESYTVPAAGTAEIGVLADGQIIVSAGEKDRITKMFRLESA